MHEDEKNRVLVKLSEMSNYIKELRTMLPPEKEYEDNLVKRRACEKTVELAIESMIDVCSMIISFENVGVPSDEDNIFEILMKGKIITKSLNYKLKQMKGFRNIIVHKYGDVDDNLTYRYLSTKLKDFDKFKTEIMKYLDRK